MLTAFPAVASDGRLIRSDKDRLLQGDAVDGIKGDQDLRVEFDGYGGTREAAIDALGAYRQAEHLAIEDDREKPVGISSQDDTHLQSWQRCNSMPSGYCCGMSPKMIRLQTSGTDGCACGGPQRRGAYTTQAAIDNYCNQVMQPCQQLSHIACCDMSPQMIRVSTDDSDMCWCSGPHNGGLYQTQAAINDWCSQVIRPCSALSDGHCCHLQPAQLRQGSDDKCWCTGPLVGSNVTTQQQIDIACSEVIQPCDKLSRSACCGMNPPQVRYKDGIGQCWCSGPVAEEQFKSQDEIDEWCAAVTGPTTSTSTSPPAPKPCNQLSEAQCCAKSPKKFRLQEGDNRCICSSKETHGIFHTQQAIDTHCAMAVRLCDDMTEEDCCAADRALVGIDSNGDQTAIRTGPDAYCTCTDAQLHGRIAHREVIDRACKEIVRPCKDVPEGECCLKSPKQIRKQSGENCWCSPWKEEHAAGSIFKSQKDVDDMCGLIVKQCDVLLEEDCCTHNPKQVRVRDSSGNCYCRGPHLAGDKNWDQQSIDQSCREVLGKPTDLRQILSDTLKTYSNHQAPLAQEPAPGIGAANLSAAVPPLLTGGNHAQMQESRNLLPPLHPNPLLHVAPGSTGSQDKEDFQLGSRHSSLAPSA
eukprot:CAMPEP_0197658486 /NCGR_PEP_ID=MMETSP1338-20131121/45265_1 /TAXON_ID=43686 ORGANISM="Pelagodinium beii, Strain RCC1491" /NCGR_SAMPLE_ID=MMETSP1338 /ASSEMBLY_ACC=CAM_ASM_000754 /LENGTH=636 /DNA_ID=CAMNT_0043235083 /DNA_START=160 /DNA_END=2070 /DNA_ORIENTATION=-